MNQQFLLLLIAVPITCYYLSGIHWPSLKWRLSGIAYGLVIAPISLCLLHYTNVPLVGKLLGFVGLVLNLIHGSPGYFLMIGLGIQEPGIQLTTSELLAINTANGIIWGVYYGIVGYNFDAKWAGVPEYPVALKNYKRNALPRP